jgi:hypothetical protein
MGDLREALHLQTTEEVLLNLLIIEDLLQTTEAHLEHLQTTEASQNTGGCLTIEVLLITEEGLL